MDGKIEELCYKLTLNELTQEEIHVESSSLEEVIVKGSHCLLAKLNTSRPYNQEVFKAQCGKYGGKQR